MRSERFGAPTPPTGIVQHGDVVSTIARVSPLIRHWGVWDGEAGEIIHAALPVISTSSWQEFANGDVRIEIVAGRSGGLVVARARSQLGRKYHLLAANCEQFARWAATDKAESVQLQRAAVGAGAAAFLGWLFLADHGTYDANGRLRDRKGRFK